MRIAEMAMAIALAALSLYFMWKSGERPSWSDEARFSNVLFGEDGAPAGGFWPFWVAGIMFLCCIWVFVNGLLRRTAPSQSDQPYIDAHGIKVLLTVGIPLFLMVLLTQYISMYFAMALFLFYYLLLLGGHGLLLSSAMALVVPFWLYLFFDITMSRNLPKGLLALEDAVYVPAGNWFRALDGSVLGILFIAGGVILVAASMLTTRRTQG